jgi:hypothetical protein
MKICIRNTFASFIYLFTLPPVSTHPRNTNAKSRVHARILMRWRLFSPSFQKLPSPLPNCWRSVFGVFCKKSNMPTWVTLSTHFCPINMKPNRENMGNWIRILPFNLLIKNKYDYRYPYCCFYQICIWMVQISRHLNPSIVPVRNTGNGHDSQFLMAKSSSLTSKAFPWVTAGKALTTKFCWKKALCREPFLGLTTNICRV